MDNKCHTHVYKYNYLKLYICVCVHIKYVIMYISHSSINPETALSATEPEFPSSSVTMPKQQGTICKITVPVVAPSSFFFDLFILIMYYWCKWVQIIRSNWVPGKV